MQQKRFMLIAIIYILFSFSAYAQYETLSGISAESPEYADYKLCIDSCSQCEQNCKTNTYRRAAETQNKEEFCNYLPEEEKAMCKERIFMANAIQNKDSAECQKITDEFQKKGCLLNVHTEKAIEKEKETECNLLEADQAEACRQAFYIRMALSKADTTYCDKITDAATKEMCKGSIIEEPAPSEEKKAFEMPFKTPSKSLIMYGIIILAVIILAVIAIVIIKKLSGKKPREGPPLMVQQQKFPPLVMQQGENK